MTADECLGSPRELTFSGYSERENQPPHCAEGLERCEPVQAYGRRGRPEDVLERCEEAGDWLAPQQGLRRNSTLPVHHHRHTEPGGD